MGCDYYEDIYLKVEWEENGELKTRTELLERRPHWLSYAGDSDSEEAFDRELEKSMIETENRYGEKLIYQDNEWKISSKNSISEYSKYLPDLQVGDPDLQVGDPDLQVGDPDLQVGDPDLQVGDPDLQAGVWCQNIKMIKFAECIERF